MKKLTIAGSYTFDHSVRPLLHLTFLSPLKRPRFYANTRRPLTVAVRRQHIVGTSNQLSGWKSYHAYGWICCYSAAFRFPKIGETQPGIKQHDRSMGSVRVLATTTTTYVDDCSLLEFPKMIRMWVSRAKWSIFIWLVSVELVATPISSKFGSDGCWPGELMSLLGECGGVAYSGDMQPKSERSASLDSMCDPGGGTIGDKINYFLWRRGAERFNAPNI